MKKSSILVALLGVVIGLLIALLVYRIGESRRMLRVNGNDWRKSLTPTVYHYRQLCVRKDGYC